MLVYEALYTVKADYWPQIVLEIYFALLWAIKIAIDEIFKRNKLYFTKFDEFQSSEKLFNETHTLNEIFLLPLEFLMHWKVFHENFNILCKYKI